MKYSLDQNLSDYGFAFYEKIHEPIFLINRVGKITKMNEAGRKLLKIAKVNLEELNKITLEILKHLNVPKSHVKRIVLGSRRLHLIARNLNESNFILVEIKK